MKKELSFLTEFFLFYKEVKEMKVCEAIPFKKFKEKIRIVKELERKYKNAAIEIHENFVIIHF